MYALTRRLAKPVPFASLEPVLPFLKLDIQPASDRSLLISFGPEISIDAHRRVMRASAACQELGSGVVNLHPAFASLLIDFDPRLRTYVEVEALVRARLADIRDPPALESRTIEIPVVYGGDSGPDLLEVANHTGLDPARVIEMHTAPLYLVYFLGFAPGFPYLGGLPGELSTPRLQTPRKRVPAGSVAIGGSQTGIYPLASPGGWRIIGRTAARLFDPEANPPALLRPGDSVRFVPRKPE
jgi:KipI family sensor histidine kinase inhibitor